jgi:hypothetical protein
VEDIERPIKIEESEFKKPDLEFSSTLEAQVGNQVNVPTPVIPISKIMVCIHLK